MAIMMQFAAEAGSRSCIILVQMPFSAGMIFGTENCLRLSGIRTLARQFPSAHDNRNLTALHLSILDIKGKYRQYAYIYL